MADTYHVYAKCNNGHRLHLQVEFTGSRAQCRRYLDRKVKESRPTHFNFISKLDFDAATRRYLG